MAPAPVAPLPRRDDDARAALADTARRARPVSAAHERVVEVPGPLGALIPGGGLRRGAVVAVDGAAGAGVTSLVLALAAAVTAVGEWAAAVDLDGSFGGLAAAEAGVALDRFAVVRRVPPDRWATAVAALLDGVSLVVAELPRSVRAADARRLVARAREREVILVPVARGGAWPAEAALRFRAAGGPWPGLDAGSGVLADRTVRVEIEGRGVAARTRSGGFARAGLARAG
ncbi:MAG: hypothetical protein WDA60_11680 [Acidimicrobiia bacterium]|jgi:hypothetical protein